LPSFKFVPSSPESRRRNKYAAADLNDSSSSRFKTLKIATNSNDADHTNTPHEQRRATCTYLEFILLSFVPTLSSDFLLVH